MEEELLRLLEGLEEREEVEVHRLEEVNHRWEEVEEETWRKRRRDRQEMSFENERVWKFGQGKERVGRGREEREKEGRRSSAHHSVER